MSNETEQKLRHFLTGYMTPILTFCISVLLSMVAWFAKDAYAKSTEKQDQIIVILQDFKTEHARLTEKVNSLEKLITKVEGNVKDDENKIEKLTVDVSRIQGRQW